MNSPTDAPACFYFRVCRNRARVEKNGKTMCRACAARCAGREFPLRPPSRAPLYKDDRELAVAMDLRPPRRAAPLFVAPAPARADAGN
jgi:hypothetical protein